MIRLWRWRLDPPAPVLAAYRATLSAEECARADRFIFPQHRRRFVAAHGRLREILAAAAGTTAAALRFADGGFGKPVLVGAGEGLHFNLSHSGELAVLAVSAVLPLGIDVEELRPGPPAAGLAARFFAPAEAAAIAALPEAERVIGFFRCWTRKEAFVKAVGRGLQIPLGSFRVSVAGEARLLHVDDVPGEAACWRFVDLAPAEGFAAALAVRDCAALVEAWVGDAV